MAALFVSCALSLESDFDAIDDVGSTPRVDSTSRSSISAATPTTAGPFSILAHEASSHIHAGNSRDIPDRASM